MPTVSPPLLAPSPKEIISTALCADAVFARRLLGAGIALMAAALLWLTRTEYALPPGFQAVWWGINPMAAPHWAQHLRLSLPPPLSPARWDAQFRAALALLWLGYGMLAYGGRRAVLSLRTILAMTAGFGFALAVFSPPLLATDVYAYAASGRLSVLYGQNPYVSLPYSL